MKNLLTVYIKSAVQLTMLAFIEAGLFVAAGGQTQQGQWSTLSVQSPINPVHMALMHNGKVLIVSGSGNVPSNTSYAAAVFDPQAGTIATQPLGWDMFCSGMAILPDGRPFVVGGTIQYDPFLGASTTSAYDPAAGTFSDQQRMAHGRWYPTIISLGDGSLMTFSGFDETGTTNTAVEIYKTGVGWSQGFVAPWTPPLYPRLHLLPNGTVFYSGSGTSSNIFDPTTKTWTMNVAQTNYATARSYGTSVLLPLTPANGYQPKVMIMGGGNPATATTEIIDLSAASPQWVFGPSMSQPRVEMNATILPNGEVVALGGSANDEDGSTASFNADIYDPSANTFTTGPPNSFPRLYHSNSLLLPDATVMVAGSNPARGTYEPSIEIYSPPYLFNSDGTAATRPVISGVTPGTSAYGGTFQVQTPDAASITSVVLMRPSAVTHAFDMEQRLVGLSFTAGNGVLNVTAPPNGNIAPQGYYMLFILNSSGVPSVASFIQLTPSGDTPPTAAITSPAADLTVNPGQPVSFAGSANDPDGTIASYSWIFPGGSPPSSAVATPGNVAFSTPGAHVVSLTVTDNAGLTNQPPARRTVTVADFSLSASPSSQLVLPGGSTSYSVSVAAGTAFTGTVSLNVAGLPSGAAATFSPPSVSTSGTSTMNVTTSLTTPIGSYPLTISGSSGGLTHSTTVTLGVGVPAIGLVTHADAYPGNSVTFSNTTAGDFLVVAASWNDLTSDPTVSDSALNKWNALPVLRGPSGQADLSVKMFYATNIKGGNTTITLSSSPADVGIHAVEYSGVATSNPLDVTNTAVANGGTTTPASGSFTPTAGDLVFVYYGDEGAAQSAITAGQGYSLIAATGDHADGSEENLKAASGAQTASFNLAATSWGWAMYVATFKP